MDIKFLEQLSNVFGPSGHEDEVQQLVKKYGEQFADSIEYDRLGSVIFKKGSQGPKIMLAGHSDEIGFVISAVTDDGYLKISNIGGWWPGNVLSHQIVIRPLFGKEKILGVVACKPPHILSSEERNKLVPLKDMFIDIGCTSKKEVEALGIQVGDPAVPYSQFRTLERTRIENKDGTEIKTKKTLAVGKAFDDRVGVFIVTQVLKKLAEENISHPNTVYLVSTTQEEVGLRGARTSAQKIQPDVGFALDVDISGDMPGVELIQKMGNGVTISAGDSSMIPNPKLRKLVIELAEKHNIKWQPAFLPAGGTDAGIIHLTGIGAPALFVGIPTRHIHSHNGEIDLNDVEQAINLLVEVIKNLDDSTVKSFYEI